MKLINESIYWRGIERISNFLKRLLHEVLVHASAIILAFFFFLSENHLTIGRITPKKCFIFIIEQKYA